MYFWVSQIVLLQLLIYTQSEKINPFIANWNIIDNAKCLGTCKATPVVAKSIQNISQTFVTIIISNKKVAILSVYETG